MMDERKITGAWAFFSRWGLGTWAVGEARAPASGETGDFEDDDDAYCGGVRTVPQRRVFTCLLLVSLYVLSASISSKDIIDWV